MTGILKITMFIAHLPLSVFPFFQKKVNSNKLNRFHTCLSLIFTVVVAFLFLSFPQAEASFNESIAIDTKAISLANNVTADPPGIMSIHYNPAGLSLLGDGNYIMMGLIVPLMKKSGSFATDPDHKPFHDFQGNAIDDPVAGKDGGTEKGRMYLPLMDKTIDFLVGPGFGLSHRTPGSRWTFAYSAYAPFAGGWVYDDDDPSRYGGKALYLQHIIYAGPAVSYRVNNNISLGASFGLGQSAMGVDLDMRAPNEIVNVTKVLGDATQGMSTPIFDLTIPMPLFGGGIGPYDSIGSLTFDIRDDFSPSFNLGAMWEPLDWLSFGLCYQSPIKSHMTGKFDFQYSDEWQRMVAWSGSTALMQIISMVFDLPYEATSQQTGNVSADLEFPQMINLGMKVKPIKKLSIMGDLKWANWSSVKEDNIQFDQKIQLLQLAKFMGYAGGAYNMKLARDFSDTWNWGVGLEYQLLDWLALRAGYENRTTSTVERYYDLMYALPSLDYYGAGMGIKWNSMDINFALGYMTSKQHRVAAGTSINMNSDQLGAGLNIPYRGLSYEEKVEIFMGSVSATMPLEMVTGMVFSSIDKLTPARFKSAKKSSEVKEPVDSSSAIIDNMRFDGKYYYTEDSE
ncbi:MAG: outer membrane protein transport protein [Deltaproteobacteria bacterium]|nr:outer membrane protein transport protein [Deltaproteobacteria bacterium]